MAKSKRFTATEKWEDQWFYSLPDIDKLFWLYLLDNCDHAGIWQVNWNLVGAHLKGKVNREAFASRIQVLSKDRWFIPGFITFQYGTLNQYNRVHASVIKILEKYGVDWISLSPLCIKEAPYVLEKGLKSPDQGAKDKDKDKDSSAVSVSNGEGECEGKPKPLSIPQQTTRVVGSAPAPAPDDVGNYLYDESGRPRYRTLNRVGVACIEEAKQFATAYLKKQDLNKVIQAWDFIKPPLKEVLKALEWQLKQPDWLKTDDGAAMRWMPTPEKYLLDRMWEQPRTDGVSYTLSGAELDESGRLSDPAKSMPTMADIEAREKRERENKRPLSEILKSIGAKL
jgi:hypothetical protein